MKRFDFSVYKIEEEEDVFPNDNGTIIRIFANAMNNKSVMITVADFNPYVYLELPSSIQWTPTNISLIKNKIKLMTRKNPTEIKFVLKKKLYYANVKRSNNGPKKYAKILFPYIFVSYKSTKTISKLFFSARKLLFVSGIGNIKLVMDENAATPSLQMFSNRKMNTGGWNTGVGIQITGKDKESTCKYEFVCEYLKLKPKNDFFKITSPKIMSIDGEMFSENPAAVPNSKKPSDKIFQFSCVVYNRGDPVDKWKKILLSLGKPRGKLMDGIICKEYETEADLLLGITRTIQKEDPQIIIGYNILMFDIPYLIDRAKINMVYNEFDKLGYIIGKHATLEDISWTSAAYGKQTFKFLNASGRLMIDLLPLVKRSYKLGVYRLGVVAEKFLGHTKDPLKHTGIFKCYRVGMLDKKKGRLYLGICGKYCVTDSVVVGELFDVMNIWVGLCEEATALNVPIIFLYTKGQQIRMYSQMYRLAIDENVVVQDDAYITGGNDYYSGAIVIEPVPGLYENVVTFDFTSLYPTTIISSNISFDTLVNDRDGYRSDIDNEDCNIFEWDDHIGCIHDTIKRKTKPKKIICAHFKFRWLKEYEGILCKLLLTLLTSRTVVKKDIKKLKKRLKEEKLTDIEIRDIEIKLIVLDKRQWSYKISANSAYGAMGVGAGYLPFLPGAMCTTAGGREHLLKAVDIMTKTYGAKLIYGDTDSTMVIFPDLTTSEEIWDYALKIEKEIIDAFPKPMQLAFEGKIYVIYLILSKKRYMARSCKRDGIIEKDLVTKGVLLARRDNSLFTRTAYKSVIDKTMDKESRESVEHSIVEDINNLFTRNNTNLKHYIITKKVGPLEKYKVKELPKNDPKELQRLFTLKKCSDPKTYFVRCLPAQVQLAVEMRKRGMRVDAGTRLEYVVTTRQGVQGKQWEKIEDPEYFKKYNNTFRISPLYYLKSLVVPMDQILTTAYGKEHRMLNLYKIHLQKDKINKEILSLFTNIEIVEHKFE
jgi:DNA polymerase elongation subunit (family B)